MSNRVRTGGAIPAVSSKQWVKTMMAKMHKALRRLGILTGPRGSRCGDTVMPDSQTP